MDRRTDKYLETEVNKRKSRVDRNESLYDNMGNIAYAEAIDLDSKASITLSNIDDAKKSRSSYQQVKEYKEIIMPREEKKEPDKNEEVVEVRNFDINSILEEAKKNREEVDELEKKRKLRAEDYNVLSNLNKKYLHKNEMTEEDTEELKELINTITSNSLAGELKTTENEKDLLSDLMATNTNIDIDDDNSDDDSGEEKQNETVNNDDEKAEEMTNSFYTKSLEITKNDFNFKDEIEEETKNGKVFIISLIIIILLLASAVAAYFILKHFGIKLF